MTRHLPLRGLAAAVLVIAAGTAGACGKSPKPAAVAGRNVEALNSPAPPPELLGLKVHLEDMNHQVQAVNSTYVRASALYSLRRDDVVQGTLQISQFMAKAPYNEESFRRAFLAQLSGTAAQAYRLGDQTVYQTNGLRQHLAVWFRGQKVYVLSMRDEFEHPRDLIRAALELPSS